MLDKCGEGTRYIYRKQFKIALLPNGFSVAYARLDERDERESRPGGETRSNVFKATRCFLPNFNIIKQDLVT